MWVLLLPFAPRKFSIRSKFVLSIGQAKSSIPALSYYQVEDMKHEQKLYAKGAICRPVGVHRAPIGALCEGSSMWTCGALREGSSMWLYSACLFWNKQATHILKTIKILLLMVQFHNGTLKSCELGLGGDRHWLSEPTTCLRIIGKELCFHKTGPIMMPKRIGCKISTIFICTYRRQDDQNCHS